MTPHDIDKATLLVSETRRLTERWYEIMVTEGQNVGNVGELIVHMVRCMDEQANALEQAVTLLRKSQMEVASLRMAMPDVEADDGE